jgi:hypothetical protein
MLPPFFFPLFLFPFFFSPFFLLLSTSRPPSGASSPFLLLARKKITTGEGQPQKEAQNMPVE